MSDRTVAPENDEHKNERPADESNQDRRIEDDPNVKRAKSGPGEVPNRDEDEFDSDGLKTPDIEQEAENESPK